MYTKSHMSRLSKGVPFFPRSLPFRPAFSVKAFTWGINQNTRRYVSTLIARVQPVYRKIALSTYVRRYTEGPN